MSKTYRIFMVEDEVMNHPLFVEAFAEHDFTVCVRDSARDGLVEDVVAFGPDIISMDLMLGQIESDECDGFAAIEMLQGDARTKDIPIFVLTSFFQTDRVQRAKALGAKDFINLQGQTLRKIPEHFRRYLDSPRRYVPVHQIFRDA